MTAQHSHISQEHYTPAWLVEAARTTLGEIDLDPASCPFANELIKARYLYTDDMLGGGLARHWNGKVFCNPPGKVKGKRGGQAIWWAKACSELLTHAEAIVFVSFSVELLQTAQNQKALYPLDFPCCFPKKRVAYDREEWGQRISGTSPPHSSMIVCLTDDDDMILRFQTEFERFGKVVIPG